MGAYLKLFLEHLPAQTCFEDLEIVLDHNDPSPEELLWVKHFQENYPGRLKHIITEPVEPIGTSMNTCIRESSGEYLAIWNVDDLRTPNSIQLLADKLDEDNDVSHGNFIIVNKFGATTGQAIDHMFTVYNPEELERGMCIGPFFMFKKALLEKTLWFDEQLKSAADFDLAVRLAKHGKVGFVPEFIGYYLDEGKGASTRGDGIQPIERTVVELRYGIDDKVEQAYVKAAKEYDIKSIYYDGRKHAVGNFR